jgi:hypothetical protein
VTLPQNGRFISPLLKQGALQRILVNFRSILLDGNTNPGIIYSEFAHHLWWARFLFNLAHHPKRAVRLFDS